MGLFTKKNIEAEPQYLMSPVNNKVLNYRVYRMSLPEKLMYSVLSVAAGGIVGLIFYGGLFKDKGESTLATYISNAVVFIVVGLLVRKFFIPIRTKQLKDKRKNKLKTQFMEFLASLSTSLSSGMNVNDSLKAVCKDLSLQFSDDSSIVIEVKELLSGMENGVDIENMLEDFGNRSGIDDISNFAKVFSICYRTGGNLQDVVSRSSDIISEKILISEEIETKLTSNKTQFKAMNAVPIILVFMLRIMSAQFAESFASFIGVTAITIAIVLFVIAYQLGEKIMDIRG